MAKRLKRNWMHARLPLAALISAGFLLSTTAEAQMKKGPTESTINRPPPSTKPEVKRLRMKWFVDNAFDAYTEGVNKKRAIILFFHATPCGFCQRQLDRFRCPYIARHSGFLSMGYTVYSSGYKDSGGQKLAEKLKVKRYPTMVMLMPDADRLHVIGRVEGEFSAEEVDGVFRRAYDSDDYRKKVGPPPDLLSASETALMQDQLGIARPDPKFCANKDR